ncbi:hypothetical protein K2X30_03965 [bacterium]|nr:hypothetical protein [bacterium]
MPFSSFLFLCGFLPTFIAIYYLAPARMRNAVALVGSLLFYIWGEPYFSATILIVSLFDFFMSLKIASLPARSKERKRLLALVVALNVGVLVYFKYAEFFLKTLGIDFGIHIALPMGVSFIIFEEISYIVDVYRNTSKPARQYPIYALFLFLFPHSIAGPIFRWRDMESQFYNRTHSLDKFASGVLRFIFGLGKKILIADAFGKTADLIFSQPVSSLPSSWAWLGAVAYTIQIYFDFSGYSDMAIGLGRMMGFSFLENFNSPYFSTSMTDFWRRWHMSLSRWMRDYLYIPLGGNQRGSARTYLNLCIVFTVSGLWHGANWTFVAWGFYHGLLLIFERLKGNRLSISNVYVNRWTALFFIILGWVLFRAHSITQAGEIWGRMLGWNTQITETTLSLGELLSNRSQVLLYFLGALYLFGKENYLLKTATWIESRIALKWGCAFLVLYLSLCRLASSTYSPFLYFRF